MSSTESVSWERRHAAVLKKAAKLWPLYKDRVPVNRTEIRGTVDIEFEDWVEETNRERRTKVTTFRFDPRGKLHWMFSSISKAQKFLVANGPLAGRHITNDNPDYVRFNRNDATDDVLRCVLIYRPSIESEE